MKAEPLMVYLPDTRGVTVSRYGKGNLKLGPGVYTYSRLPGNPDIKRYESHGAEGMGGKYTVVKSFGSANPGGTCPGSTSECEEICVASDTPVLTRDLEWVPAGSLSPGASLLGFDESMEGKRRRRLRLATVIDFSLERREAFSVVLASGTEMVTTPGHPWLVRKGQHRSKYVWEETRNLGVGDRVPRFFQLWRRNDTRLAGYMAGLYDGEGSWASGSATFYQKPGPILDSVAAFLVSEGYSFCRHHSPKRSAAMLRLNQRAEAIRFLGEVRPLRLLSKQGYLGQPMSSILMDTVMEVRPAGVREVAVFETSTGTFIASGFGAHNCYAKRISGPVREMYARNGGSDVPPIPDDCTLLRIHVSGDFDTRDYITNWHRRLSERPDVTAWVYTRSWRVPDLLPYLEELRALPNVQMFASMDMSTLDHPPAGWRRAWIDGDRRATWETASVPREERTGITLDGTPTYVCPEETGHKRDCQECGYCFQGLRHDVTFLRH